MSWTRDKPTRPGKYRMRRLDAEGGVTVHEVPTGPGLAVTTDGDFAFVMLDRLGDDYEWSGPLEPPP